jgi:hypothetical protein
VTGWRRFRNWPTRRSHGIPVDLKDALRKSATLSKAPVPKKTKSRKAKP